MASAGHRASETVKPMTLSAFAPPCILVRLGAVALVAAALASCAGGSDNPLGFDDELPKPADYPVHGIDVSKYQGTIDWGTVAQSGVKFVWIKATEGGDHLDERFQANWEGAKQAGIPHGAYHFVYWCRPPMEEMAFFEQNAPVEDDALPPVLDVEATPTSKTCHKHLTQDGAIAALGRLDPGELDAAVGDRTPVDVALELGNVDPVDRVVMRLGITRVNHTPGKVGDIHRASAATATR